MFSELPKVVHPVLGRPMILRVLETARSCGFDRIVTVVGHGRESLVPMLDAGGFEWAVQDRQLGTAHAVSCALPVCGGADEYMVLLGDVPLLRPVTVMEVLGARAGSQAAAAVLTARPPDASGYGRVVREAGSLIARIVEEKDATPGERGLSEVNTGVMAFDGRVLESLLARIQNSNSQGEYYLTDAVSAARGMGLPCIAVEAGDWAEAAGINDQFQLAEASLRLCRRLLEGLMASGVSFEDPGSVWIEDSVEIGPGTRVGRFVKLTGGAIVGRDCLLGDGCMVSGGRIPDGGSVPPYSVLA